jgi:hypothetical protein
MPVKNDEKYQVVLVKHIFIERRKKQHINIKIIVYHYHFLITKSVTYQHVRSCFRALYRRVCTLGYIRFNKQPLVSVYFFFSKKKTAYMKYN